MLDRSFFHLIIIVQANIQYFMKIKDYIVMKSYVYLLM